MSATTEDLLFKVTLHDGSELVGVSLTKLKALQQQGRLNGTSTVQESPESAPCPADEYIELWSSQHMAVEPQRSNERIRLGALLFLAGSFSLILPVLIGGTAGTVPWTVWIAPLWMATLSFGLLTVRYPARLRRYAAALYVLPLIELVSPARDPSITALVAETAAITCGVLLLWPARPRRPVDLMVFGAGLAFFAVFFLL